MAKKLLSVILVLMCFTASIQCSLSESLSASECWKKGIVPKPGDIITLGQYEQDNNKKNGMEPIEWIVVTTYGNKCLLLSKYGLWCSSVSSFTTSVSLDKLNFTQSESEHILAEDNIGSYHLLSITYFNDLNNADRKCKLTKFAKSEYPKIAINNGYVAWFLGLMTKYADRTLHFKMVNTSGEMGTYEIENNTIHTYGHLRRLGAIRPAIWVSFNK